MNDSDIEDVQVITIGQYIEEFVALLRHVVDVWDVKEAEAELLREAFWVEKLLRYS